MKKRILSLLCVFTMVLSLFPASAFADETPDFSLGLTAKPSTHTMTTLRAGDTVTVSVLLPAKQVKLYAFQAYLNFDKNYFTCTEVNYEGVGGTYFAGGLVNGYNVPAAAGWDAMKSTDVVTANSQGYLTPACATYKNASGDDANGIFGNSSGQTVAYYAKFTVKNDVIGNSVTPFSITNVKMTKLEDDGTTTTSYNVGLPESISATVVQELSTVSLSGSITLPTKDGTDTSSVTGSNVTATVTWSPALTNSKFAANTEYTATVKVTPNAGYVFADNVKFSGLGNDYNFKKQSDGSYAASHKFPATASKTVKTLEITTGPTKTSYSHGDTFDTTGMVVKATYDDNSVEENFKGYAIENPVVRKGDTTVTLKCGTATTTQTITVGTKELSITDLKATDRNYDGTTNVALTDGTLAGVLAGDKVSVTMPTSGAIADANAGTGKDVTVTKPTLTGGDAGNYTLADITGVKVNINKAPLTITAKDKTVIYGDALSAVTYEYTGFVSSETESVVTGLDYDCDYTQFANAGTYAITPKGATAANYDIKYVAGKLTVDKKPVTLTWSVTGDNNLYYDGKAKNVTATASGLVNEDTVGVTVAGGTATEIGKYTAKAVGLTGEKAGNYKLPEESTQQYNIVAALNASDLTVKTGGDTNVDTVTKTIDGLTIKLVGYAAGEVTVSAADATVEGDKLTIHDVVYTIDKTGVKEIPADVEVKTSETKVKKADKADETITNDVVNSINDSATKGEGLNEAAAEKIVAAKETIPEGAAKVEVKIELNIQPISLADGKLKLDITPEIEYTYKDNSGLAVGEPKTETLANNDIKAPVTISVKLPTGMSTEHLFAKHYLSNGGFEYLTVTVSGDEGSKVATWQQSSFSEVELISDSRSATVTFQKEDGSAVTKTYTIANVGEALPTDSKSGYTFNGWTVGDKTYKTLTDEALTAMAGLTSEPKTLSANFTKNSSGHSGGGGGGGSTVTTTTYDISVPSSIAHGSVSLSKSSAAANDKVTLTVKADKGYTLEVLKATDANGKEVALTAVKLGEEYTFVMPASKVSFEVSFMDDNSMLNYFVDVNAADYFYDAVLWAAEKKITTGVDDLHFAPNGECTRAQIVTFLWRAAGSPEVTTDKAFSDVAADSYYAKAVAWAVANGITTGTEADKFSPDATCTRAHAVTFLARALKGTAEATADFTDVAADSYYASAVAWAKANGITTGVTESLFGPDNDCTRAQIVTFLWRAYEK